MRRIISILMAACLTMSLLPVSALAEEPQTAIYISESGSDKDTGLSAEAAVATLRRVSDIIGDSTASSFIVYVMSNLTTNTSLRTWDKHVTLTSYDADSPGAIYTITRGDNMAPVQDAARSTYNPAMIESNGSGVNSASLTLYNITLNDAGIAQGGTTNTYFIQADSDGDSVTDFGDLTEASDNAISNTDIVQDAMIATYNGVSTITLGSGTTLKNYGGMSAVRLSSGTLIMESGSVICDGDTVTDRVKGTTIPGADTSYYGPAGAIWMQGGELIMEEGAAITDLVGRAIYNEAGSATINGTFCGIKNDPNSIAGNTPDFWWGSDGVVMHMRGGATAIFGPTSKIDGNGVTLSGSGVSVLGGCELTMENGSVVTGYHNGNVLNIGGTAYLNGEITGLTGSGHAICAQSSSNHYIRIGETANIHDNICAYGVIYTQGSNGVIDIYGKINDNISTDRGGALTLANNGSHVEANMYDGAEMCNNVSYQTGGAVMVSCGTFTMSGGVISGNISGAGSTASDEIDGGGVYVRRGGQFIMEGGKIIGNSAKGVGGGIAFDSEEYNGSIPYVQLSGGTIADNVMKSGISGDNTAGYTVTGGISNDIAITSTQYAKVDRYLSVSDAMELGDDNIYMSKHDFYIERVDGVKLGNTSTTSETALNGASTEKGWSSTLLAAFWLQSDSATTLNLSGIKKEPGKEGLPVYALVMPTDESGTASGTAAVYALAESSDGSMAFAIPHGNTNGYAVALIQPSTDYGTLTLTAAPTSIQEVPGINSYTVNYAVAYSVSENLRNLIEQTGTNQTFTLIFDLDDNLTYTGGSMTVNGQTANVTKNNDGTLTVTFSVSSTTDRVTLAFSTTAALDEGDFDAGTSLVTSGNLTAKVGATAIDVPSNSAVTNLVAYVEPTPDPDPGTDPGTGGGESDPYLRFDSNGGTDFAPIDGHGSSFSINPYEDEDYGTHIPSRPGYRFTGWYRDSRLARRVDEGETLRVTGSMTLFAGWEEMTVPALLNGDDHYAYIQGYADGTVRPNASITRAQVATIFFRLLDEDVREEYLTTSNRFPDVDEDYWANTAISTMAALGVINGRNNGTFDPGAYITRAEFAAICSRFDDSGVTGVSTLTDISGHWAEEEIRRAAALGWIHGFSDGTFRPDESITRAQAVTMINRVLCRQPEEADDLLPGMNTWTDCRADDWFYLAIQEAGNSHDYRPKDETYESWTVLHDTPDWSRYE